MSKNRSGLYVGLLLLAAALAGYMVSRQLARQHLPQLVSGTALPVPRVIAPFALTDHTGRPFGNAELAAAPSLVFFGFTHCPDICPTTLALSARLRQETALQNLRVLFITVDPGRDDQMALQRYVNAFGTGITGLRGPDETLDSVLRSFGAARAVEQRPGGDYFVDHSSALLYTNASGAVSAAFTPPFDYAKLRDDLTTLLASGH
jgi:protein SCO1/2